MCAHGWIVHKIAACGRCSNFHAVAIHIRVYGRPARRGIATPAIVCEYGDRHGRIAGGERVRPYGRTSKIPVDVRPQRDGMSPGGAWKDPGDRHVHGGTGGTGVHHPPLIRTPNPFGVSRAPPRPGAPLIGY